MRKFCLSVFLCGCFCRWDDLCGVGIGIGYGIGIDVGVVGVVGVVVGSEGDCGFGYGCCAARMLCFWVGSFRG